MTAHQIKSMLKADPFLPFSIQYRTGQVFEVPRAEYAWVPPIEGTSRIYVADRKGTFDILDASWITGVVVKQSKPRRRKAG